LKAFQLLGASPPRPPLGAPPLDPAGGLSPRHLTLPPRFSHPGYGPGKGFAKVLSQPDVKSINARVLSVRCLCNGNYACAI